MSLTDTARHWLCGCAATTAASKSDVNVAMPHLRGRWSPTKAILRTLVVSFMRLWSTRVSAPYFAVLPNPADAFLDFVRTPVCGDTPAATSRLALVERCHQA